MIGCVIDTKRIHVRFPSILVLFFNWKHGLCSPKHGYRDLNGIFQLANHTIIPSTFFPTHFHSKQKMIIEIINIIKSFSSSPLTMTFFHFCFELREEEEEWRRKFFFTSFSFWNLISPFLHFQMKLLYSIYHIISSHVMPCHHIMYHMW